MLTCSSALAASLVLAFSLSSRLAHSFILSCFGSLLSLSLHLSLSLTLSSHSSSPHILTPRTPPPLSLPSNLADDSRCAQTPSILGRFLQRKTHRHPTQIASRNSTNTTLNYHYSIPINLPGRTALALALALLLLLRHTLSLRHFAPIPATPAILDLPRLLARTPYHLLHASDTHRLRLGTQARLRRQFARIARSLRE